MRRFSPLISRYVFQAILPYFGFAWLLLSVILFVQQAGKHSDLLFSAALPNSLIWQLTIALIPNVIAFTCPIAALVGVIIGISRMQGDSEMVAIRAAGVGNLQISLSVIILGILLSLFALFINMKGVPFAAGIVKDVVLRAAIHKMESPVEPGVFNSELAGYTVYVKSGDMEKGVWRNIFIHQEDKEKKQTRLITAKEGRIDSEENDSEIVLKDASVTTFDNLKEEKIATENVEDLRLLVQTKRKEIIERLSKAEDTPQAMGLQELAEYSSTVEGEKRVEAEILWQRRILLSITPLLFALLGAALVTRFNRGGRGFGVVLALVSLVVYYLLTLLGEQLARTGVVSVFTAGAIPFLTSIIVIGWFFTSQRLFIARNLSGGKLYAIFKRAGSASSETSSSLFRRSYFDFPSGILDLDLIWNLIKNYVLTLGFLTSIFLLFTAFELWKFAGTIENGVLLLTSYLLYLTPFIYIQIAPSALMIATLATYTIKSRQNEVVTWTAAGQSIYRLLLPCFLLMIVVGFLNFGVQESLLTEANRKQDALRAQIRSRNKIVDKRETQWVAVGDNIYSFVKDASDNETKNATSFHRYEFDPDTFRLRSLTKANRVQWNGKRIDFLSPTQQFKWQNGKAVATQAQSSGIEVSRNPFEQTITKPSHLDISETYYKVHNSGATIDQRTYRISLYKKYATPFLPFIITLFAAPFALSLNRKGNVLTLGYAVAIWLLFMGVTNVFEQLGSSGYLLPLIAVGGPLLVFALFGIYLLSRIRT